MAKGISKKSIEQANNVMVFMNAKRIKSVRTQCAMYRIIECIKFPYTKDWVSSKGNRTNVYGGAQYDPILNYLIRVGYITKRAKSISGGPGYRYEFEVTPQGREVTQKVPARSIKEEIVAFVESRGNKVKRKEIIEFLVDAKWGKGTYAKNPNSYRGYYSCAFSAYGGNNYLYEGACGLKQNFDKTYSSFKAPYYA